MVLAQSDWDLSGLFRNGEDITPGASDIDLPWQDMIGINIKFTSDIERATVGLTGLNGNDFTVGVEHGSNIYGQFLALKATTAGTSANLQIAVMGQ